MLIYLKTALQLLLPFIVSGVITICYLPVYRKKINERLEHFGEGKTTAKPIVSPLKFFIRTLLIIVILFILTAALAAFMFVGVHETGTVQQSDMQHEVYVMNVNSPSMLDNYTPGDEIPGYTITGAKKDGNFEVYYYALPEVHYQGLPDGFIGIRYTGSDEVSIRMTAETEQTGWKYRFCDDFESAAELSPVRWYSTDISDFFGNLDITAFAMTDESLKNYGKAADEADNSGTIDISGYADSEAELCIDLAEAYGMDIHSTE